MKDRHGHRGRDTSGFWLITFFGCASAQKKMVYVKVNAAAFCAAWYMFSFLVVFLFGFRVKICHIQPCLCVCVLVRECACVPY